jgi:Transposase
VERCAGLDWAKDAHQMCALEGDGEPLLQRCFTHDERGLDGMCELLVELEVKRLAIERPDGVLVERLLEAGLEVLPIHPNQLKAARPRFRASGGKSDSFDAFCLAELARTDHHRFRVLAPHSDETKALRALTLENARTS